MADIDPDTLLEWLTMGQGDERDMQLIALEQLCMLLLMSDNVDKCFESCPPRTFLPALCHIFMDETAPDNILEVTARAITYYLDVSAECSRRIVSVDGAVKALCTRLVVVDIDSRTSKDLAEQCVKVLELMCTREAGAIYEAGGLTCILTFIRQYGSQIHKDTLHSAMSVVARLCTKMEPTDQSLEDCVDSLSMLLKHEDNYVADGALRCFACLADRFTRRGVDPAPLAKHGLTNVLLEKLATSALAYAGEKAGSLPGASPDQKSNSGNVSIIVSVLSTLCRGSPTVTHDLFRSDLLDAIDKAMQGDERCVLDTMRLIDLLLVLLFEGRDALPKSSSFSSRSGLPGLRRMDSSAERSHRQLIDCIRSKDTDALIEAIDSGTFEVNFMDDVGQTLLNWASAFGTLEMVEFLCERGSDVNRGQRSSSLHYAACFGRPAVAKVLLRYGANPDLRDEDGKTPLDKARERNDEGHKEVVRILQSPGEWMVPAGETPESGSSTEEGNTDKDQESAEPKEPAEPETKELEEPAVKGDPEMAPVYLKRLLPIFAQTFRSSLLSSIRKATLAILKKMIHYIPPEMMEEVVTSSSVATQIVDVISAVIGNEGDDEGHLTAFQCVEDLMSKGKDTFLVHFVRLGVLNRITEIAKSYKEGDSDVLDGALKAARKVLNSKATPFKAALCDISFPQPYFLTRTQQAEIMPQVDATSVVPGKPYHWHDWCIVRGRDCLYLWSDFCAIELSNGSNGWFRFILDGKLATMYSSGSPEGGSGSSESRTEFLEKLQRARSQVSSSSVSQPILSSPSPTRLVVGNWSLACNQTGQVTIHNTDGQQATILKEDLPGFVFESNRGTKHTFTAETSLGADFATTWSGKPGRKYQSKKEQLKQRLSVTAHDIYQKYFKEAEHGTYGAMGKLREISQGLNEASQETEESKVLFGKQKLLYHMQGNVIIIIHANLALIGSRHEEIIQLLGNEEKDKIRTALRDLCHLLQEESMLSSYEIQSSGLVTALFNCLNRNSYVSGAMNQHLTDETSQIFKSVFGETIQNVSGDESLHIVSLAVALVKKLIAVLESVEKLPVLKYEHGGGGSGLQALLRRLRFRLERDPKSVNLIDRSTKYLKMEPLTTVAEVERYLLRMVAKQWYDYERNTYKFIQVLKENSASLTLGHSHDFDENGIIYWIGTNAKTVLDWVNPAEYGLIAVSSSEGRNLPYGRPEDIVHRDAAALNCHTNDDKNAWFTIDMGLWIIPTTYTLRHARGYGRSALRNWLFQGSKDGQNWTTLSTHKDDTSLNDPGSTASWPVSCPSDETRGWRMFRIQQAGPNASGQTHYLSLSGFEMYGSINGVADEPPGTSLPEGDSALRKQRRLFRSQVLRQMALGGKEGTDLKTLRERAKQLSSGIDAAKSDSKSEGWVDVSWVQSTAAALQKLSSDDPLNVKVVDISDPEVQAAISEADKSVQDSKSSADSRQAYDSALKSVVDSLGKRDSKPSTGDSVVDTLKPEGHSPMTRSRSESDEGSGRGLSADLANLRLLMAVEDLLDNASSDLVASALAEAASLDQLRAAARNLRSSFLQSSGGRLVPSSQGSRESTSPPSEPLDVQNLNIDGKRDKDVSGSTSRDSPVPLAVVEEDCASDSTDDVDDDDDDDDDSWHDHIKSCNLILNKESSVTEISFKQDAPVVDAKVNGREVKEKEIVSGLDKIATQGGSENDDIVMQTSSDSTDASSDATVVSVNVKNICNNTDMHRETTGLTVNVTGNTLERSDVVDVQTQGISQEFSSVDSNQVDSKEDSPDNKIQNQRNERFEKGETETVENEFFDARSDEMSKEMLAIKEDIPIKSETEKEPDMTETKSVSSMYVMEHHGVDDNVNISNAENKESDMSLEPTISKLVLETMLELGVEQTEAHSSTTDKEVPSTTDDSSHVDGIKSEETDSTEKAVEELSKDKTEISKSTDIPQRCSFLVDMEDDDMDDYHMDDGDDEDEFEDIENEDENDPEELYEPMPVQPPETSVDRQADNRRRLWDDDYVLKRQHSALIPAFDPRPGRTNVAQTQDVEIPDTAERKGTTEANGTRLKLYLKSSSTSVGKETEIPLEDANASIFSYAQQMALMHAGSSDVSDKQRRVWEPTYTIVYRSADLPPDATSPVEEEPLLKWDISFVEKHLGTTSLPKSEVVRYLQQNADSNFLRKWKLIGTAKSCRRQRNCNQLLAAYKEFCKWKIEEEANRKEKTQKEENSKLSAELDSEGSRLSAVLHKGVTSSCVCELLDLLKSVHKLSEENSERVSLSDEYVFDVPEEEFISKKLTNKLQQQIQDPLVLTTGSLPAWCDYLVINYPMLFPFETRQMYFQATAFGCSRSIVWLQNMQDATLERNRGHPTRRLEPHEFRIGRLKHERIKVPRGEGLMKFAMKALQFHADRKAILEIEFKDEEGTGLGPSLEFYALVAREIQKKDLGLWVASDILNGKVKEVDSEEKDSKVDLYVHHPNGLFPAPYPPDHDKLEYVCRMYNFFGIFLAKCLQDNRLVDIPLSGPFYKLLCLGRSTSRKPSIYSVHDFSDVESVGSPRSTTSSEYSFEFDSYRSIFSECDFEMIYPELNEFIKQLKKFVEKKKKIEKNDSLSDEEKRDNIANLMFETKQGHECRLEDLGLTFQYIPPSKAYGFDSVDLKSDGESEMLSADNAEEYIELLTEFCLFKGIRKQVEAFEAGFNRVFPMDKLHAFSPREIQRMLCGEQAPRWTKDDLMNYTEPKFGYSRESPGFLRLVNVLLNFSGEERKLFLQFATGCSSLPPGGLANLHPRLTVVRKDGEGDGSYPSVNTCVHYLKLPDYSSEEVLREKLLAATREKGFHLN